MRVDQAQSLRVGATVLVSVGELEEVGATVVWVEGGSAGLRFAQTIDPHAARSKTIIPTGASATRGAGGDKLGSQGAKAVSSGWVAGLNSPYRK